MGSFCSLYITGTAGGTVERREGIVNHSETIVRNHRCGKKGGKKKTFKLTYNLKVHITIPRRRKFKVDAASKVASVFFLAWVAEERGEGKTENR